ncbi:hypothetical protein ABPG75_007127 [Micractinium tetrahymenae]
MRLHCFLLVLAAVSPLLAAATALPQLSGYRTRDQAVAATRQLASASGRQKRSWYREWLRGRSFDERRYRAWESSLNKTAEHNLRPGVRFFRGINAFSDVPFADLAAKLLMRGVNPGRARPRPAAAAAAANSTVRITAAGTLPDEWDIRDTPRGVPPVRPHQGDCGSCWQVHRAPDLGRLIREGQGQQRRLPATA